MQLANMTWRNPIFMIVLFGTIWYLPGIILRRRKEHFDQEKRKQLQKEKLDRLYNNKQ